jgi:hypothetical protein
LFAGISVNTGGDKNGALTAGWCGNDGSTLLLAQRLRAIGGAKSEPHHFLMMFQPEMAIERV